TGFAVHRGVVDGVALCRMFNCAIDTQHCRNISARTMIRYSKFAAKETSSLHVIGPLHESRVAFSRSNPIFYGPQGPIKRTALEGHLSPQGYRKDTIEAGCDDSPPTIATIGSTSPQREFVHNCDRNLCD